MNNRKKGGFIVSAELLLIATIMVLGLLVGMVAVRDAMIGELHDVGSAHGALNQSYGFSGTKAVRTRQARGSRLSTGTSPKQEILYSAGATWRDQRDAGDSDLYTVTIAPATEDADSR